MRRFAPTAILAPLLVLALAVHWWLWPLTGTDADMDRFLLPWFRHIRDTGPIAAFAAPFGDYAPSYLYLMALTTLLADWIDPVDLIKALSVAGTLALAAATAHLVRATIRNEATPLTAAPEPHRAVLAAAMIAALPSTAINAVLMGQCDAMWAAACVMALAAALGRRHGAMMMWCGVALGFKLQAAFFAPFVLALLIRRRVPFRLWLAAPVAWLGTLLPAWLAGWPAADLLTIYFRQADTYEGLALSAPNIWMIAEMLPALRDVPLTGLALAAAVGAAAAYVAWFSVAPLRGRLLAEVALLAPLIVVGLLPRMHERYFFLADVIALAIATAWPDRRSIGIALLVQMGSLLALAAYLSGYAVLAVFGAVPMVIATIRLARPLLRRPANDNPPHTPAPALAI